MKAVLTFRSVGEPFWEDVDPITTTYSLVVGQGTFLPFPSASGNFINITQSSIFNSAVLTNNGKLYCWPQWTLTGPGSNIVLFNKTTDRRLQIDATLAAGEVITVETDPASRGVFAANGDSLMNLVNLNMGQPDFWPLIPGAQTLQLEVNGADANARIAVSYRNRYMPA